MTIFDQIIATLGKCPTARELLADAKACIDGNDGPGAALRFALAGDVLAHNDPALGDPLEVARLLAAGVLQIPTGHDDTLN